MNAFCGAVWIIYGATYDFVHACQVWQGVDKTWARPMGHPMGYPMGHSMGYLILMILYFHNNFMNMISFIIICIFI